MASFHVVLYRLYIPLIHPAKLSLLASFLETFKVRLLPAPLQPLHILLSPFLTHIRHQFMVGSVPTHQVRVRFSTHHAHVTTIALLTCRCCMHTVFELMYTKSKRSGQALDICSNRDLTLLDINISYAHLHIHSRD